MSFGGGEHPRELISQFNAAMSHRGPDGHGEYHGEGVSLGQRRLSVIDLRDSANPPLVNENGSVWIVFNGEIYGFAALREELEQKGHRFKTLSDTEVILHLYEEEGPDCVRRLRGMFAFAIWDGRQRLLFAARDRMGKKPFVYSRTPNRLYFASEIRAILAAPDVSRNPNLAAIDSYLTWQYVPSPQTAFSGIERLPAGHRMICRDSGEVSIERYWQSPPRSSLNRPAAEIESELLSRLREAVQLRMVADVPLGAFLSGGIDSGLVVALMASCSSQPVRTFTIGFEEEKFDERPFAREVASRYGTRHEEFLVRPDVADLLPRLVHHYGEPFADSSAIPTFYLSRETRRQVTVALSGDGGDESFSGYDHYTQALQWEAADQLPAFVRRLAASAGNGAVQLLPDDHRKARLERAFDMLGGCWPDRYRLQVSVLKPQEKDALYTGALREQWEAGKADWPSAFKWDGQESPADWMMRFDQSFYLADCLMVKTDIASMANSLEVRCPLLDHHLVEFAASIPVSLHRDSGGGKRILRRLAQQFLPERVLSKPKTGFAIPLAKWLRTDLRDILRGTLLDEAARRRGLFNSGAVERMVHQHLEGSRDWSNRLWAMVFLELWFRTWIQ